MKLYKLLFILLTIGVISCNYLDVVPDEVTTEDDAFRTIEAAENFLYSCYSYIPNSREAVISLDWLTGDEIVTAFEHETFAQFPKGNYTANDPFISYWNTLFSGIKQCYLLINNIDKVPNLDQSSKDDYIAQVDFLIAYYHFLLLRCYGPIILVKEEPVINTSPKDFLGRTPYDECVDWIAERFDDVALRLPANRSNRLMGLATSVAAKAIKSRMLLYAASPLYNGNSMYADFKNPDGTSLINTTFDVNKWSRAKEACKEAIEAAEAVGHRLYMPADATAGDLPEPADPIQRALRFTLVDKASKEHIWIDARPEGFFSMQNKSRPWLIEHSWNGISPTLTMLDRFYSKNGLPIDQDPAFDYEKRFSPTVFDEDDINGEGQTQKMNIDREPRYYAWISFHNGYYECQGRYYEGSGHNAYEDSNFRGINNMKVLTQFMRNQACGVQQRSNNYSPTGFLNKKGVHPASNSGGGGHREYPWPVVRLGELYLNYAEACVESGDLDEAKVYINKIRERAGIPTLETAWGSIGVSLTEAKMRGIVRQERMIEMYMEHQNFWDMRRWLLAGEYFDATPVGNNIMTNDFEEFCTPTPLDGRVVAGGNSPNIPRNFASPRNYLMPIPYTEVQKNKNLVQNPGY
jgi:hypothetical protein